MVNVCRLISLFLILDLNTERSLQCSRENKIAITNTTRFSMQFETIKSVLKYDKQIILGCYRIIINGCVNCSRFVLCCRSRSTLTSSTADLFVVHYLPISPKVAQARRVLISVFANYTNRANV